eukprot:TRINITY_DN675_c1_g1_i1.p1 TRINITY_DN675_c1_g1~~TRINITY_DN675_c1_g1_i1.p1  ORF type:complete len:1150 (+),score=326.68 TRINITY_DN675_c1_g1_i1:81-3452(+)
MEQVLQGLMSNDNATRAACELALESAKRADPDALVVGLLGCVANTTALQTDVRHLACTLLRPLIALSSKQSLWQQLKPEAKAQVKAQLLAVVMAEKVRKISSKLSECVADLGAELHKTGEWPELLPFLFQCSKSQDPLHRSASLRTMSEIAGDLGANVFRTVLKPIYEILQSSLADPDIGVRIEALLSTATFLQLLEQPEETEMFQNLLPLMLECTGAALQQGKQVEARNALEVFLELADQSPLFFRPHLAQLIHATTGVITNAALEDGTRRLALQLLLLLSERRPKMMMKQPQFVGQLLQLTLSWLMEVQDDREWYEFADEVDTTNSIIAEESLDRVAQAFGGKAIVPVLFSYLPTLLTNANDWRQRYTGALAISICGEGCFFVLKKHLTEIFNFVKPLTGDPHPKVRWAALNCIGQMCVDYEPTFAKKHGSEIISIALQHSYDSCERVAAHCLTVLINLCEHSEKKVILPFLDSILSRVLQLLQSPNIKLVEVVVTCLSAIAICSEEAFCKYYDTFVPWLKSVLKNANTKENRWLRGKAMECLTLIGLAIKDKFFPDAREVMEEMLRTQVVSADDPQIGFIETSFGRMCEVLGRDFIPFLPLVMPSALARAAIKPDYVDSDDDSDGDVDDDDDDDDEHRETHTETVEDKAAACHVIIVYAEHVKEGFFPYVEQVAKLFVPDMKFTQHEGVRSATGASPPILIDCVLAYIKKTGQHADGQLLLQLWQYMFEGLIEAAADEPDVEVLAIQLGSIGECLDHIDRPSLTPENVQHMVEKAALLLEEWRGRRTSLQKDKRKHREDEEEIAKLTEQESFEDDVLVQLMECLCKMVKYHAGEYLPLFQQKILPLAVDMLTPEKPWNERQKALVLFDDLVEYGRERAVPYLSFFVGPMLQYTADPSQYTRQAAVFGIGICAQYLGEAFAPFVPDALARLHACVRQADSHSRRNIHCTENAISAILKICRYQSSRVNHVEATPVWLSYLPLRVDQIEANRCYDVLCSFLEQPATFQIVMGENFSQLPRVLAIFGAILSGEAVLPPRDEEDDADDEDGDGFYIETEASEEEMTLDEGVRARIGRILMGLQRPGVVPTAALQATWAGLSESHKVALQQEVATATAQQAAGPQ